MCYTCGEEKFVNIGDVLFMKDKKTITLSIIMLIITFIIIYTINNYYDSKDKINICKTENCNEPCISYKIGHETFNGSYCKKHTCAEIDCYNGIELSDLDNSKYCTYHKILHEDDIILSEQQIEEIKLIIEDYVTQLKSKNDYILAVHLLDDEPETSSVDIKFSCLVIREDTNGKDNGYPATLYLIEDGDSFKVTKLEYNE